MFRSQSLPLSKFLKYKFTFFSPKLSFVFIHDRWLYQVLIKELVYVNIPIKRGHFSVFLSNKQILRLKHHKLWWRTSRNGCFFEILLLIRGIRRNDVFNDNLKGEVRLNLVNKIEETPLIKMSVKQWKLFIYFIL